MTVTGIARENAYAMVSAAFDELDRSNQAERYEHGNYQRSELMIKSALVYLVRGNATIADLLFADIIDAYQGDKSFVESRLAEYANEEFLLCHSCATAIENDDYSAFDYSDERNEALTRVTRWVESAGHITIGYEGENISDSDYWGDTNTCDACSESIDWDGFTGHVATRVISTV